MIERRKVRSPSTKGVVVSAERESVVAKLRPEAGIRLQQDEDTEGEGPEEEIKRLKKEKEEHLQIMQEMLGFMYRVERSASLPVDKRKEIERFEDTLCSYLSVGPTELRSTLGAQKQHGGRPVMRLGALAEQPE